MAKYRKKPVVIEAIQWDGTIKGYDKITTLFPDIILLQVFDYIQDKIIALKVATLEGISYEVTPGYYIIRGVKGEYYPCEESIFLETYELVEE